MPRHRTHIHYSEPIAAEVCRRVREGATLKAIGADPAMPSRSAVCLWRARLPGFAAELERARALAAAEAGGRVRYGPDVADAICARVAAGETLAAIVAEPGMPPLSTLYLWLERHPEFAAKYERARALVREAGAGGAVYTEEVADAFCQGVAAGEPLVRLCSRPGMPSISALYGWLARRPEFAAKYDQARELRRAGGQAYVTWSEAAGEEICRRVALGESLTDICRDPTLPDRHTVLAWRRAREDFAERLEAARDEAGEMIDDEMRSVVNAVTPETASAARAKLAGLVAMGNRIDRAAAKVAAKAADAKAWAPITVRFVDPSPPQQAAGYDYRDEWAD